MAWYACITPDTKKVIDIFESEHEISGNSVVKLKTSDACSVGQQFIGVLGVEATEKDFIIPQNPEFIAEYDSSNQKIFISVSNSPEMDYLVIDFVSVDGTGSRDLRKILPNTSNEVEIKYPRPGIYFISFKDQTRRIVV